MKYLLLIHLNNERWDELSTAEQQEIYSAHDGFQAATKESGELVGYAALRGPEATVTVRERGGVRTVTDGPYLEAKEYFAGYYLVDTDTRERAVELAGWLRETKVSAVEVRPLMGDSL